MVRVQLNKLDPPALQDDHTTVALRSGGGKFKTVTTQKAKPATFASYGA